MNGSSQYFAIDFLYDWHSTLQSLLFATRGWNDMIWSKRLVKLDGSNTTYISSELWIISFCMFQVLLWGWLHSVYPQHGVNLWQQKKSCQRNPWQIADPNLFDLTSGWNLWPDEDHDRNGEPLLDIGGSLTTPTMALHAIWSMRKCQLFCSLGKSNAIVFHRILEKTLYKGAARNPILRRDIQLRKEIKCESFDGACCIHRAMMPRASESLNFPAGRRSTLCMVDLVDVRSPWNQTCFKLNCGPPKKISYKLI